MIAWVDIETTGLDEREGHMLEIAVVVTDDQLGKPLTGPSLTLLTPTNIENYMPPIVVEMHTKSGLLDALKARDFCVSKEEAEKRCIDFFLLAMLSEEPEPLVLEPRTWEPAVREDLKRVPLAGSSVHFDRRWLRHHMPKLDALFSYRIIDVSTIEELAKRWAPMLYEKRPDGDKAHRALADVTNSIATLRHYRDWRRCALHVHAFDWSTGWVCDG